MNKWLLARLFHASLERSTGRRVRCKIGRLAGASAGLLFLATGCETVEKYSLTHKLWATSDLSRYSEPAPNVNLALFDAADHHDVLVQYDAMSDKHCAIKRRAYFLEPNRQRVPTAQKPLFVDPATATGLRPIPLESAVDHGPTNAPSSTDYARLAKEGREFTLHRSGATPETFELPVYLENPGTCARVALTPFAVAGDAVMVGGVAAVVGLVGWLTIGAPGLPPPPPPHPH
jgi:hypothetical protein